jgi:autotransporter-associated beta strand protein
MNNNAAMTGSQGLIVDGGVMLIGAKTFTGDTVIRSGSKLGLSAFTGGSDALALQNSVLDTAASGGTIWLEATGAGSITGAAPTTSATFGGLSGNKNLSAVITAADAGNNVYGQAVTAITGFTLNPGTGITASYSGSIGGFGTGASGGTGGDMTLTKTGAGTQILSGNNTYTGATTISGGTLSITGSGSINTTSGITINGGKLAYNSSVTLAAPLTFTSGTLGGTNWTGSLDALTIGSGLAISPGNSPGTASTGDQTWASAGTYVWEVNNATGTAGTDPGWDLLAGTGTLDITATSGSPFTIDITSLDLSNNPGSAANFSDGTSYDWLMADFANPVTGFDPTAFTLDTTSFLNSFTGSFSIARGDTVSGGDNTQLYIVYTAVPEPAAIVLAASGVAFLGLRLARRRR